MKKIVEEISTGMDTEVQKALEDALIWGQGFIKVSSDGRIARVAAEEVDQYLAYLRENGKKLLEKVRKS